MQNSRIVYLTTGLAFGGAESQLVQLALGLRRRGWAVEVVSMTRPKEYQQELYSSGINVISLDMQPGIPDPRAIFHLARELRAFKPAILHSHMVHANLLGRVVRLTNPIPVQISTAHSINEGGRLRELFYRLTDRLCDLTTNVSQVAVNRYIQVGAVPAHKITLMPNGVNTEVFKPDVGQRQDFRQELGLENCFVWLAVGRFEPEKDHTTMLQAFAKFSGLERNSRLLLVGEGRLEPEIRKLTKNLNLDDKVMFLGPRKDIPRVMNGSDGYLMSSAWEGLPMVLLEAASCGLPIVATDVGGNREIVMQDNGFLVTPGDPAALSGAMRKMSLLSEEVRQALGSAGRRRVVQEYSFENIISRWEAIYWDLFTRRTQSWE